MVKVAITGIDGLLGSALKQVLKHKYNVLALTHHDLDVSCYDETVAVLRLASPDIVIHCAAMTSVDLCENRMADTFKVNSLGTRNVVLACKLIDAAMVYISTDYVFDGKKRGPYYEFDQPNPINIYGKSKLEGEAFVKSFLDKYYIVRSSWLYGENGNNFVNAIIDKVKNQSELRVVSDQCGSPTYVKDLSIAISQLIEKTVYGVYHITNSDYCTWYDFARLIVKKLGVADVCITPISSAQLGRDAVRPENSVLENFYWTLSGFEKLRTFDAALEEYLNILYG